MAFDGAAALEAVARFCDLRDLTPAKVGVVARLDRALTTARHRGPDPRWRIAPFWVADDDPGDTLFGYEFRATVDDRARTVQDRVLAAETRRRGVFTARRLDGNAILSTSRWARFSRSMTDLHAAGVGWVLPTGGELLLVPMPAVRTAEGRPDVLHDDTGRPAVEWWDGTGSHYLQGAEFTRVAYLKVIRSELLIQEIAQLENADQRSVAVTYMSFERLVVDSDAELLDVGVRGTRLYRLPLPFRIRADRVQGYGAFDYFIHMRDASHPEREFVEWVSPDVGRRRNAELCQAHAFGITLEQWLSVDLEG